MSNEGNKVPASKVVLAAAELISQAHWDRVSLKAMEQAMGVYNALVALINQLEADGATDETNEQSVIDIVNAEENNNE
jgi:hypothetical protein